MFHFLCGFASAQPADALFHASTFDGIHPNCLDYFPWGEALNPGPQETLGDTVSFSFSNPSGLRNKEGHVVDLGPGVHAFSETQLSHVTQGSCARQLRSLARQQSRGVRVHFGAPAPLRIRSDWAGSWTGVATISDYPGHEVVLPYASERSCGRVLTTRHYLPSCSILHAVVYGFPTGPTWPQAKSLTSSLLEILTQEVVFGSQGPRLIGGDFNMGPSDSEQFHLWKRLGWQSAQQLALELWDAPITPTCKGQTERDLVWLSPEAVALCRRVCIHDVFSEHSTVSVRLTSPLTSSQVRVWPLPSAIPWEQVDSSWHSVPIPSLDFDGDPDANWAAWAGGWEQALDSHVSGQPFSSLQPGQKGRFRRSAPLLRDSQIAFVKPSRHGEVQLRNDLVGCQVKKWFKQLRRLQSLVAAVRNMKDSCDAVVYRLELWSSILGASGFRDGFRRYWVLHRSVTLSETPSQLPTAVPSYPVALAIFETFKACFESLETWHLRQRSRLLQAKYTSNHAAVFHDLKPPQKPPLDLLVTEHQYEILAVDETTCQIHVSSPLDCRGSSQWFVNDEPGRILVDEDQPDICTVTPGDGLQGCTLLSQKQTLTSTGDIHHELLSYWKSTWCALSKVDDMVWARIVGFFQAFVPRFVINVPPLTVAMWRRGLKRFKKTAARGVDGISPADLLALPDHWTELLLKLLHRVEAGIDEWPRAILFGIVNLLAKDDDACTIPRFRPVVVFSVIYRAWSSIRSRQLLRQLQVVIDSDAYGFVPGCEPSQLWLVLQAEIECCLQQTEDTCGLSVDLIRAFNHIPRQHSFALAQHLGVPFTVLTPWKAFLGGCTRAFKIHDVLSESTISTCGMPEGDALSVYAMVQLNLVWHIYQKQFCPSVRACSFVGNLSLTAARPADLAQGYSCLCSFFELWNLQIDLEKSYCWSLSTADRSSLRRFPMKMVYAAPELGGSLSFCRKKHHGLQLLRSQRFSSRWLRLERSMAPLNCKLRALSTVFWPAILHGANATLVGADLIDSLRVKAMKHLRLNKAGTNPFLRLALCGNPVVDPGFWLLRTAVFTFRRLIRKEPMLLQFWVRFHACFDGNLFAGPCSQLLCLLNQVGWQVHPPFVVDHDDCSHNLLLLPCGTLQDLLQDAWFQFVSKQVSTRKTMDDLVGLDTALVFRLNRNLDGLQLTLLAALQSGTFCSSASHAKFDCTKVADCSHCGVRDTQHHWLICPRYAHLRTDIEGWDHHCYAVHNRAFTGHLLPSRSPYAKHWKQNLLDITDSTDEFESPPDGAKDLQHIFTDGTSYSSGFFQCAAWGAVNATSGLPIGRGHVSGLCQSSDRAELTAVLAAAKYQAFYQISVCLWLDCKFVADGLRYLLGHWFLPGDWEHQDLWSLILEHIMSLGRLELHVQWGPSHLDASQLTDALEDWFKYWNDSADSLAQQHNMARGQSFYSVFDAASKHARTEWTRLLRYREFFFRVAASKKDNDDSEEMDLHSLPVSPELFSEDRVSLCMLYNHDIPELIRSGAFQFKAIPPEFMISVLSWLDSWHTTDQNVYSLTFIELTMAIANLSNLGFPFMAGSGMMEISSLSSRFERPTFTYLLGCIRPFMLSLVKFLGWGDVICSKQAKVDIGIIVPSDGIHVRFPLPIVQKIRDLTMSFFKRRPFRRSSDLARPL